jgi:aryl-alcohol dehydrogenase-like predicted oxidoreductase
MTSELANSYVLPAFLMLPQEAFGKPVCRLGLASHGHTQMTAGDVLYAVERGVNFLNWAGESEGADDEDAFRDAISSLGSARDNVVVCIQFGAMTADDAERELRFLLRALRTDYIDVVTLYYVERPEEWQALAAPGGVVDYLRAAKKDGVIRRLGITSHQRPLAAEMARSGLIDCVMIRYNAAHRGAERDVFPTTDALGLPVIAYTATRWSQLMEASPADPPGFVVPRAPAWYRFVLQAPSVAVVLAAPHSRSELEEDLEVLAADEPLPADQYEALARHGERVRASSGPFA